jgi:Tol biopolymer transport system component
MLRSSRVRLLTLAIASLAVIISLAIGIASAAGSVMPFGPRIAYMSDAESDWAEGREIWHLYLMQVDRRLSIQLTDWRGQNRYPTFSPDGETIYFHRGQEIQFDADLYAYDLESRRARPFQISRRSQDSREAMAAVSPDGQYIAFHADIGGAWNLYLTDPAGELLYNVTRDMGTFLFPAWSPDGTRLAFSQTGNLDPYTSTDMIALTVTNVADILPSLETGFARTLPSLALTDEAASNISPSWSPDSRQIVYASDAGSAGIYDLYVVDADGGEPVNITDDSVFGNFSNNINPVWLPDGRILFASDRAGSLDLYVINPDGSGRRRLTFDNDADEDAPAWWSDG